MATSRTQFAFRSLESDISNHKSNKHSYVSSRTALGIYVAGTFLLYVLNAQFDLVLKIRSFWAERNVYHYISD